MKNLYNIIVFIAILFTQQSLNSQQNILSKIHEIATIEQKVMMPMRRREVVYRYLCTKN